MRKNKNRRVLSDNQYKQSRNQINEQFNKQSNDSQSRDYIQEERNYRSDSDNYEDRYEENPLYRNSRSKNTKSKKILLLISFIISLIFIGFIFVQGLFYISSRFVVTAVILLIHIICFFIFDAKKGSILKFVAKVILIVNIIFSIVFMGYYLYTVASLSGINRDNIPVSDEIKGSNAFNIMVLGLDTEGNIENSSRSDVNILLSVNLKSKDLMMTSIPRDTYLPIALGGNEQYDKLTHAANYGAEASLRTIENTFSTSIPYYFKINFTSFVDIVDVIGGIDVYNSQAFTSNISYRDYPEGNLHLDGSQALDFVRQRYGLANGDLDRGRNQEIAIQAIMKKLISPMTLIRYPKILDVLENSISTNIPINVLFNIISEHALSGGLNIENKMLNGYGEYGLPSYAMPGYRLFMYVPYDESIKEISRQIQEILNK